MAKQTLIKTSFGRTYKEVGLYGNDRVFAPIDKKDMQVLIYTKGEVLELLEKGKFTIIETEITEPSNVILNDAGLIDCSKTCTKAEMEKCMHHEAFRRNPKAVGGLGLCFKLKGELIPKLQYNNEFHYYHTEEGGQAL